MLYLLNVLTQNWSRKTCVRFLERLVEEQVLEGRQQCYETGRVVGRSADDCGAVGTLEVGLDHLVVLAVTERHRT